MSPHISLGLRQGSCAKWNQWSLPNQHWSGTTLADRSAKCTLAKRKHWGHHSMQVDKRTQRRSSSCKEASHHPRHQNPHPNHPTGPQRPVDLPFTRPGTRCFEFRFSRNPTCERQCEETSTFLETPTKLRRSDTTAPFFQRHVSLHVPTFRKIYNKPYLKCGKHGKIL